MSILDFFRSKRIILDPAIFPIIIEKLALKLETIREEFVGGFFYALKGEGITVTDISPTLQSGSELDSALKGFQLTCVVGFAMKKYINLHSQLSFDQGLKQRLYDNNARVEYYNERYLDCQGNIDCLSSFLSDDIYRIWGSPDPEHVFKGGLSNMAPTFMILCQAATARLCGDGWTEKDLKSKLHFV